MLIPVSLLWIHIIILILAYLLGRVLSKFIEPIPIDNILKEVHNKNFPITSISIILITNIIALIILQQNYIPTPQTLKLLSTYIDNTIPTRIIYLIIHIVSFLFLQPTIKFLTNSEYKHKLLSKTTFIVVLIGIIHSLIFFIVMIYVILTT